ncbi:BMP family ABC transporter substrate-binding protein [Cryobacterium sp. TMT1-62]|uniref:BMP family lipoprotein n=1 Tax=unclassified Cryobacterium TaxID=2649013 RepID=UPI000CE4FD57|nr:MULTISPECIES: BMP family ABC transporter substrate-binding protein [unclassified Cryobacterium]TFB54080.1 BMP family ABC transporter substrate-binding protein [Cryobacterium sp. Sr3]TFC37103.1 BMP family ABC transporter substrate-binding protein [Cryobacterium sp. TMT2-14]TFC49544.1 BMP family ABC transporter substrate-binding protein [Cryobacterium sp. TMT2-17-1]TFC68627.1 BMP family ABC transporter substrate-binding protein [Cryobacterium sp. TMT2-4]TFD32829.1 BMP family ABC transporter s
MKRRVAFSGLATLGVVALLAACAPAPTDEGTAGGGAESDYLPCIVSDFGGFDDKSFNQSSFEGITKASDELGIEFQQAESKSEDQYGPNVSSMVDQGCDFVLTVGFALSNATRDAAQAAPDTNFALIDSALSNDDFSPLTLDNVKPVLYDTAQAAFLAGYLAAGTTKTGVVGTYGGLQFPSVTIFMDGFVDGVAYHNEKKGTDVTVSGWDKATQTGLFAGGFDDINQGKALSTTLIDAGADIILPVAGPLFQGTAQAIQDSGKDVAIIGVDSDLFETTPEFASLYLTSVLKQMTDATEQIILDDAEGDFSSTPYVGTLENEGVDIAPLHDWESKVDPAVMTEIEAIKADIISGALKVESPATPK